MADLFPRCYRRMSLFEGGFVSAAEAERIGDGGGATNWGVSLRAVVGLDVNKDGVLDFDLDGDNDVDEADIRALDEHPEKREEFYRNQYWSPIRAREMPWPWCLLAFDAAVNHGVAGATLILQRAVGAVPDGVLGSKTLWSIVIAKTELIDEYVAQRGTLFAKLYAKDQRRPILGWMRRLATLYREALTT
jgi:lysozyme family protein